MDAVTQLNVGQHLFRAISNSSAVVPACDPAWADRSSNGAAGPLAVPQSDVSGAPAHPVIQSPPRRLSKRRSKLIRSLELLAPISFARQTAACAVTGEQTTRVRPLRWNRIPSGVLQLAVANWPRKLPKFSGGQLDGFRAPRLQPHQGRVTGYQSPGTRDESGDSGLTLINPQASGPALSNVKLAL